MKKQGELFKLAAKKDNTNFKIKRKKKEKIPKLRLKKMCAEM